MVKNMYSLQYEDEEILLQMYEKSQQSPDCIWLKNIHKLNTYSHTFLALSYLHYMW